MFSLIGNTQDFKYEFTGGKNPSIKVGKLNEVKFIHEISPEFWKYIMISKDVEEELKQRKSYDYVKGFNTYEEDNYNNLIDFISSEITVICNQKPSSFQNSSLLLSTQQKVLLSQADLNSDINIKIKFKIKKQPYDNPEFVSKIETGEINISVIPDQEAEFPGGYKEATAYFTNNFINKVGAKKASAIDAKFTINEEGQITDTQLMYLAKDNKINILILDVLKKMPKWKPAMISNGVKVKQEFYIAFGGGC
jgi:hypothetical protein